MREGNYALSELKKENDALRSRIRELEEKISRLEEENHRLADIESSVLVSKNWNLET